MAETYRPIPLPVGLREGYQRFPLGTIRISELAMAFLDQTHSSVGEVLSRHVSGTDYGVEHEVSVESNEAGIINQGLVCSLYKLWRRFPHLGSDQVWITTNLREGWTAIMMLDDVLDFL